MFNASFSFEHEPAPDRQRRLSLFPGPTRPVSTTTTASDRGRAAVIRRSRTPSPKSSNDRPTSYSIFRLPLNPNMVTLDDPLEDAHLGQVVRQGHIDTLS
ncbi:hypothetical protein ABW21_db0200256 [Orbilia brochopaga]|nr:hypothetical protein ABW21_db0200256 [Drechslerella brochopaga]